MNFYDIAMDDIKAGLAVFPVEERGKEPLTSHGCLNASKNNEQIWQWARQFPRANVGIATGRVSGGLIVIDADIRPEKGIDGVHNLEVWQHENNLYFPETWTVKTGSGSAHYYFRTDRIYANRTGMIEGVDLRGEHGYVVGAGSVHANGREYYWEIGPGDCELAWANDAVLAFLSIKNESRSRFSVPEEISEGERNSVLFKAAAYMQSKNFSDQAIYAAIQAENDARCNPPLSDREVRQIVDSVLHRYRKGGAESWQQRQMNLLRQEEQLLRQKKELLSQM